MPCKRGDFKNILLKDKIQIYNFFLVSASLDFFSKKLKQ